MLDGFWSVLFALARRSQEDFALLCFSSSWRVAAEPVSLTPLMLFSPTGIGGGGFPRLGLHRFHLHRLWGTAQSSVVGTDLSPASSCAVTCPCRLPPVWVCR